MSAPIASAMFPAACVVDASVLIKLFLPEQDSDLAMVLFEPPLDGAVVRAAPDLVYLECANILRTRVHRGQLTIEHARALALQVEALPLAWYASPPLLTTIINHALNWRISAYDAAYAALAEALRMPLITADLVLAGKLSGAGMSVLDLASFR
ncbi:MAG TPA: type II toxin-antitoxin system VapC family toxin [Chloroflexota bacterium]|nr:type II toxin-antitoxin system VapC family toxin [Chloroflexota bacterium]